MAATVQKQRILSYKCPWPSLTTTRELLPPGILAWQQRQRRQSHPLSSLRMGSGVGGAWPWNPGPYCASSWTPGLPPPPCPQRPSRRTRMRPNRPPRLPSCQSAEGQKLSERGGGRDCPWKVPLKETSAERVRLRVKAAWWLAALSPSSPRTISPTVLLTQTTLRNMAGEL